MLKVYLWVYDEVICSVNDSFCDFADWWGISVLFHLPIPGGIIGLIILFLALQFKWLRVRHVNMVGNFLLANMTILFLPPAVGIMGKKFDVVPLYPLSWLSFCSSHQYYLDCPGCSSLSKALWRWLRRKRCLNERICIQSHSLVHFWLILEACYLLGIPTHLWQLLYC